MHFLIKLQSLLVKTVFAKRDQLIYFYDHFLRASNPRLASLGGTFDGRCTTPYGSMVKNFTPNHQVSTNSKMASRRRFV
jgi:hypothetical protein